MYRLLSFAWICCLLLGSCKQPPEPPPPTTPDFNKSPTATILPDDSLRLIFAGDIMGHGPQIKAAERPDGSYDYTPGFRYIRPLLESADLAIGNLELTLPGQPPYYGFPYFQSPDALAHALRTAGFDLLLTSNNHANDAHKAGVDHTIQTLRSQHFYQTGTFIDEAERDMLYPLLIYRKGFRLAFLNYTYGIGRKSRYTPRLVNQIDSTLIREDLIEARRLQPDAIIVCVHWGKEYEQEEGSKQRKLAGQMLRWGADLIVGAHPHVVQPIKEYYMKRADGSIKKTVVAYSLGNFVSNQRKSYTDGGILLDVCLKRENGNVYLSDYSYHPIWRHIRKTGRTTSFEILPVRQAEAASNPCKLSKAARSRMGRYANYIRQHLSGEPKVGYAD